MSVDLLRVADAMNRQFFVEYPLDAAREIESISISSAAEAAARQPAKILTPVWRRLLPDRAAML
ncbi:MAG: hypothetical protein WBM88_14345, partial [Woeseiaceae bacterium]